jgi:hypothetical protein
MTAIIIPPKNDISDDDDLITCIDVIYGALINAYQHRQGLPADIYCLLADAFIVLAVARAFLIQQLEAEGSGAS